MDNAGGKQGQNQGISVLVAPGLAAGEILLYPFLVRACSSVG
jgi:hypothetical protein